MTLFMKQDFSPPVLSRKWIATKLRPNIMIHSVEHIVCVLESGLLFREDSADVEQGAPSHDEVWAAGGGRAGGWVTRGERVACAAALLLATAAFPPRGVRAWSVCHVAGLCAAPAAVRWWCRRAGRGAGGGALSRLVGAASGYLALARRAGACLREYRALHRDLQSVSACVQSTLALLCRQQAALAALFARADAALLGNAPWLAYDLDWDQLQAPQDDLTKIHHAYLVSQSTLLRHVALAHCVPPPPARAVWSELLYWLHAALLPRLALELQQHVEPLERMYRLLKNYGTADVTILKKPGHAINDSWLYSEVHNDVARSSLELRVALNKCVNLDVFLDSCALNRQEIDLDVLNKDLEELIEGISRCLSTVQSSQLRLKMMQYKVGARNGTRVENVNNNDSEAVEESDVKILRIEDKEPETKDEVYYFVKTEDDEPSAPAADVTTAPGEREREATRVMLGELRRKLVKREDLMRERERQALAHSMPQLRGSLPEFPRQMAPEPTGGGGLITKLHSLRRKNGLRRHKHHTFKRNKEKWQFVRSKRSYVLSPTPQFSDKATDNFEAKLSLKNKLKTLLTVQPISKRKLQIKKWFTHGKEEEPIERFNYKSKSNSSSDGFVEFEDRVINQAINNATNQATNAAAHEAKNLAFTERLTERDWQLSSSESDYEQHQEQIQLLKDIRRHRATRKKNFPSKRGSLSLEDEGLKPVEYSFGTGMAIASVLQVDKGNRPSFSREEEVFVGDGEVSEDSGNDDNA